MLGLAAGDSLGHAMHGLPAGAWSDKTAMALCLAESLVSRNGSDPADQVERYQDWQRSGRWSSTGSCVGISAATSRALAAAQWTGNPYAGSHDPAHADAEPLARIGPAVAWYLDDPLKAIEAAVNAVRITHQAPLTLDAARFFAALLAGALAGAAKTELLAPDFSPSPASWSATTLRPPIRELAGGAWRGRKPRKIHRGRFAAASALEADAHGIRRRRRSRAMPGDPRPRSRAMRRRPPRWSDSSPARTTARRRCRRRGARVLLAPTRSRRLPTGSSMRPGTGGTPDGEAEVPDPRSRSRDARAAGVARRRRRSRPRPRSARNTTS